MQISPAYANKLIHRKRETLRTLYTEEGKTSTTTACLNEDVEALRQRYDFIKTQAQMDQLNDEIVKLKHAINLFNISTVLPGLGYTIDAALVRMKMLSDKKSRLSKMRTVEEVSRTSGGFGSKMPEYTYRNYDVADVEREIKAVDDELTQIQLSLDRANLESMIEVDIQD